MPERTDADEVTPANHPHPDADPVSMLIGESVPIQRVRESVGRAALHMGNLLVRGEGGVGKTLTARAVHAVARRPGELVRVHVKRTEDIAAALHGELGAPGAIERSQRGTLVLDEIGEADERAQGVIARALRQCGSLGDLRPRVVATTRRDLETMVRRGTLSAELFEQLSDGVLWVPPLRARRRDVVLLSEYFFHTLSSGLDARRVDVAAEALELLADQRWPGNVRQLRDFIERMVVLCEARTFGIEEVRRQLEEVVRFVADATARTRKGFSLLAASRRFSDDSSDLRDAERRAITRTLLYVRGNSALAARALRISEAILHSKLVEHGLRPS